MKNFLKSSKLLFIIALIAIIVPLFMLNINASNNGITVSGYNHIEYTIQATGNDFVVKKNGNVVEDKKIRFRNESGSNQLFADNLKLYCVQHGTDVSEHPTYKVTDRVEVTDPLLAYILNMADETNRNDGNIKNGIKQNMIWWYLKNSTHADRNKILSGGITCNMEMTSSQLASYINAANSYVEDLQTGTSISIQTMTKNGNNVDITVTGSFDSWDIYINNSGQAYRTQLTNSTISIPLNEFTGEQANVRVIARKKQYTASYYLLKKNESQRLLLIESATKPNLATAKSDSKTILLNTDVSLQKYIIKVQSATSDSINITGRGNTKTYIGDNSDTVKDNIALGINATDNYKEKTPVIIEAGDKVTYRICVYNNSNTVDAKNIVVKDRLPYYYLDSNNKEWKNKYNKGTAVSVESKDIVIKDANNNIVEYNSIIVNNENGCKELSWTINSLAKNSSTYFDVTLTFDKHLSGKIENTAWISNTTPTNKKEYRTVDRDYVEMKEYSVSLEKYVTEVADRNGQNKVTYSDRVGYRYNDGNLAKEQIVVNHENVDKITRSGYKPNNKVLVESGDIVTFTIKLKNTGETLVKVTKIYDTFINHSTGYYLEYDETYGIKGNDNGRIDDAAYNMTNNEWNNDNINRYLIVFDNAVEIQPGDAVDVTIRFKVHAPTGLTQTQEKTLYNKAGIVGIQNKNDRTVWDSDGTPNNYDMDLLEVKKYSVSLEKFVSAVNDVSVEPNRAGYRHNQDIAGEDGILNKDTYKKKLDESKVGSGPVKVEITDKVTYTIRLRNTGTNPVKITQIYDSFTQVENEQRLVIDTDSVKMYNSNGQELTDVSFVWTGSYKGKNENWHLNDIERKLITINNAPILQNQEDYVDIKIDFTLNDNANIGQILANKAGIIEIQNRNNISVPDSDGEANNRDMDWIETKKYAVSLEKYVSAINNVDIEEDRSGKRHNESLEDNDANKNPYKKNNEVSVETGDIVTYTIRLKNTGEAPVKVTQIYDTFKFMEDNTNSDFGVKLKYVENSIDGQNGKGEIENSTYQDANNTNKETNSYLIKFNNAVLIEPNQSIDVTIKFQVEVPTNLTTKVCALQNKAGIVELKNNNDIVTDSDGEDNNHDMDWVLTKTYAVSLEKYVSKVVDSKGNIEEYDYREGKAQHKYDNDENGKTDSNEKYNNPVTVSNGDTVTYTIKLTNDGDTRVKITNVADYIPDGVKYGEETYNKGVYCTAFENELTSYDEDSNITNNGQTNNLINFNNTIELAAGESKSFEVTVKVIEPNVSLNLLKNVAEITEMKNRNGYEVLDTTGNNNKDADYIQLDWDSSTVDVFVEKQWEDNDNQANKRPTAILVQLYRNGEQLFNRVTLNPGNNWKKVWQNLDKYDENGHEYTYTVREDEVPIGYVATYSSSENKTTIINTYVETPPPPTSETISKTVTKQWLYDSDDARPDSITVRLYQNENVLYEFKLSSSNQWKCHFNNLDKYDSNRNEYIYTVEEINIPEDYKAEYQTTDTGFIIKNKYDAPDSPDVIIGGYVWNDIALDKSQNYYNAQMDNEENMLEGIKVYLYRYGVTDPVAIKTTNSKGYYGFTNADIDKTVITEQHKQYIKAEKIEGTQRWSGTYYSYYVVFEYDGITYTSTPNGTSSEDIINLKDYKTDSNAKEDNGIVKESRSNFNNKFTTINNQKGIEYTTKNETGYIPQSNHVYNSNMAIQSSTNLINFNTLLSGKDYSNEAQLTEITIIEDKLKYVGLGLRGRDIFDLELTSDVDNIKVTVNNQQGVYKYSNKVTLRRNDLYSEGEEYYYYNGEKVAREDMANLYSQGSEYKGEEQHQYIRDEDIDVSKTGANKTAYEASQGVQRVEVTYKITVTNASNTEGTATKITNYYDSKYTFKGAYPTENDANNNTNALRLVNELSKDPIGDDKYGYKTIETNWESITQSNSKEIYVVYELKEPASTLKDISKLATYNMVEITEYTTQCAEGQTEYTRGLIDKDSAPGSADTEKVRLHPDLIGNVSTVDYYFVGNDLSVLKYEDDTYATPTLYFVVADENARTITGKVFRDSTVVDAETKIKTGNGIYEKNKEGEVGVNGATVELIELVGENKIVRYRTETNTEIVEETQEDGIFKFTGFLPGNYIIRYYYGDTANTVLLNQYGEGVNKYSFNGEDYQSTNNSEPIDGMDTNQLSTMPNFWYVYNESKGISTAKDDSDRRKTVTDNVLSDSNNIMTLLNNIRDRKTINETDINSLTEKTHMYAYTQEMLFTVEKAELIGEGETQELKQREEFSKYEISNMNFGIAEVPVTTIDLQKEVQGFTITDSTGQNILAKAQRADDGIMKVEVGNIITQSLYTEGINGYSSQIEDEQLQGSRLQITYRINSNIDTEVNYDKKGVDTATIKEFVDIIDNNLSYNSSLGDNSKYWVVREGSLEKTSIENISNYSTIVNATDVALNQLNKGETITITLEKILSSTNSTIEEIITSTVDVYEYNNTVEILDLSYINVSNNETPQEDRIRKSDRHIIIPGVQHDFASAETITITPPTGNGSMDITYYVIAGISLMVLAAGVFGIKKFVVNTKK